MRPARREEVTEGSKPLAEAKIPEPGGDRCSVAPGGPPRLGGQGEVRKLN